MKRVKKLSVFITIILLFSFSLTGCSELTNLIIQLDKLDQQDLEDVLSGDNKNDNETSKGEVDNPSSQPPNQNPGESVNSSNEENSSSKPPSENAGESTNKPNEDDSYGVNALSFKTGYITSKEEILETEHFTIKIDANVYIAPYVLEYIEIIYDTLEIVSGLKFYNERYNPGKIIIRVGKPNNEKSPDIEFGSAYAYSKGSEIYVSSGDLLLGNSYAITHELSHILQYSQSSWHYNKVYGEGFAEYTSFKASRYLEKNNIKVAKAIESSSSQISNMSIYGNIYSQTIEYWIRNNAEASQISPNGAYAVGFRFMAYLDDVYGDYSSWVFNYENRRPYYKQGFVDQSVIMNEQVNIMKYVYGESVLDNFYAWLKINEDMFFDPWDNDAPAYDLSILDKTYIYPQFVYYRDYTNLAPHYKFKYNDLYVDIEETRNYLANYKNKDVSNLKLVLSNKVKVELYDKDNNLLLSKFDKEFSLVGVSYIKLVGSGTLGGNGIHGLSITY